MTQLRLHVAGEKNAVSFAEFVEVLNRARLIIDEIDGAISGQPRGALTWRITELGVSSADAVVESDPPPENVDEGLPDLVGTTFVGGLEIVEHGDEVPPYFSEQAIKRVGAISKRIGKGGVEGFEAEVRINEHVKAAEVTERAAGSARQLLSPRYSAYGSVLGMLGQISVQGSLTFNVYDSLTHRAIKCEFEEEQFEEVREALRCRVIVSGTVNRNGNGEPLSVEDPELTVVPSGPDVEVPVREIAGLDPDFAGGLSAGEYVKRLRE